MQCFIVICLAIAAKLQSKEIQWTLLNVITYSTLMQTNDSFNSCEHTDDEENVMLAQQWIFMNILSKMLWPRTMKKIV